MPEVNMIIDKKKVKVGESQLRSFQIAFSEKLAQCLDPDSLTGDSMIFRMGEFGPLDLSRGYAVTINVFASKTPVRSERHKSALDDIKAWAYEELFKLLGENIKCYIQITLTDNEFREFMT